jgi:hypothetical protein
VAAVAAQPPQLACPDKARIDSCMAYAQERDTMTTPTEQKYIVHLEVQATAADLSGAVQDALEQVLRGKLGDFICSVESAEDVDDDWADFAVPRSGRRLTLAGAADCSCGDVIRHEEVGFHGEFIG